MLHGGSFGPHVGLAAGWIEGAAIWPGNDGVVGNCGSDVMVLTCGVAKGDWEGSAEPNNVPEDVPGTPKLL